MLDYFNARLDGYAAVPHQVRGGAASEQLPTTQPPSSQPPVKQPDWSVERVLGLVASVAQTWRPQRWCNIQVSSP